MRTIRIAGFGVLVAAGLLIAAPFRTTAADGDAMQRLLDKAAIEDVLVQYTRALDTLDPDRYASVFAEDAVFEMGQGQTRKGRAEIRSIITGLQESRAEREAAGTATPSLMHHVMTNATLDIVSDREAHHYAYWMTILGDAENNYRIASMGHYEDVIVKRDGQWLIQSRRLLR